MHPVSKDHFRRWALGTYSRYTRETGAHSQNAQTDDVTDSQVDLLLLSKVSTSTRENEGQVDLTCSCTLWPGRSILAV